MAGTEEKGEQMLKWTSPATVDLVLDRLNKLLGVNEKGEVTVGWGPGVFESLSEILAGCIEYPADLSVSRRASLTQRAVLEAKRADEFSRDGILARASENQTAFLSQSRHHYVMLTSASVSYDKQLKPVQLDGATVSFLPHRPSE